MNWLVNLFKKVIQYYRFRRELRKLRNDDPYIYK